MKKVISTIVLILILSACGKNVNKEASKGVPVLVETKDSVPGDEVESEEIVAIDRKLGVGYGIIHRRASCVRLREDGYVVRGDFDSAVATFLYCPVCHRRKDIKRIRNLKPIVLF